MRKRQIYEQWPTTGTDTLKAIEAIQAALAAPTDNQRSPAWAVNFIWNEMENVFKSQFDWIDWFISASYESISKHLFFDERTRCYTFSVWYSGDVTSEDSFMWEMKDETRNSVLDDTQEPMPYAEVEGICAKRHVSMIGVEPEFIKIPLKVAK